MSDQLFEPADPPIRVELTFSTREGPINWDHGKPAYSTYPIYGVRVVVGDRSMHTGGFTVPSEALTLGALLARRLGVELEGVPESEAAA